MAENEDRAEAPAGAARTDAEEALRRFQLDRARDVARSALSQSLEPGDEADLRRIVADAAYRKGSLDEARSEYLRAAEKHTQAGDHAAATRCLVRAARLDLEAGRIDQGIEVLKLAAESERRQTPLGSLAAVLVDTAEILANRGRIEEAKAAVDEARSLLADGAAPHLLGSLHMVVAALHAHERALEPAMDELRRAFRRFRDAGLARSEAEVKMRMGILLLEHGDLERAEGRFIEALERFHRSGDVSGIATAEFWLGEIAAKRRLPTAEGHFRRSFSCSERLGDGPAMGRTLMALARTQLGNRRAGRALAATEAALALHRRLGDAANVLAALLLQSNALFASHEYDGGYAALHVARRMAAAWPPGEHDWSFLETAFQELEAKIGEQRFRAFEADLERAADPIRRGAVLQALAAQTGVEYMKPEGGKRSDLVPYIPFQQLLVAAGVAAGPAPAGRRSGPAGADLAAPEPEPEARAEGSGSGGDEPGHAAAPAGPEAAP